MPRSNFGFFGQSVVVRLDFPDVTSGGSRWRSASAASERLGEILALEVGTKAAKDLGLGRAVAHHAHDGRDGQGTKRSGDSRLIAT